MQVIIWSVPPARLLEEATVNASNSTLLESISSSRTSSVFVLFKFATCELSKQHSELKPAIMDPEKPPPPPEQGPPDPGGREESPLAPTSNADMRIQFAPSVRGGPSQKVYAAVEDEKPAASKRPIVTIPEKSRVPQKAGEDKQSIDITEHLTPHEEVSGKYGTSINMNKPAESLGLDTQKADQLLQEHGPNVLTPPKKRHPFLKYLDYLTSLFNLLLIVAGVLEYILLGIDFKANFQNVCQYLIPPDPNIAYLGMLIS